MNQEVSKGSSLAIALITIITALALGIGTYRIAEASGELTNEVIEQITVMATIILINTISAGICIKGLHSISGIKNNYGAFETYGEPSKIESLLVLGGINEGKAINNVNKPYKSYDTIQYRRYMKPINLFQALKCEPDTITEHAAIVADRTQTKHIAGKVESIGAYYKIGNTYLLRSLSSLLPGTEVEIGIEYPTSYASSVNIHNDYKIV